MDRETIIGDRQRQATAETVAIEFLHKMGYQEGDSLSFANVVSIVGAAILVTGVTAAEAALGASHDESR